MLVSLGKVLAILFFYNVQLANCGVHRNSSVFNVSDPNRGSARPTSGKSAVLDIDIRQWLDTKPTETVQRVSLAFLPGLAILCFVVACCFKCCGWFREHVKDRDMDIEDEYTIVSENDSDFMNVDFRSDTASAIYYDTVTSYISFIKRSNMYDTVNSYRSLNLKYSNTDCPRRALSKRVATEMRDQAVQVNFADESKKRFQRNQMRGKRFGRFEVVPSSLNSGNESFQTVSSGDKSPTTMKESLTRSFSTPTSQRKLQKLRVSFDINKTDQYRTVPAVATFVTAADIEHRNDNILRCNSRKRILPSIGHIVNVEKRVNSTGNIAETGDIKMGLIFNSLKSKQLGTGSAENIRVNSSQRSATGCECSAYEKCTHSMGGEHIIKDSGYIGIPRLASKPDDALKSGVHSVNNSAITTEDYNSTEEPDEGVLKPLLSHGDETSDSIDATAINMHIPNSKSTNGENVLLVNAEEGGVSLQISLPNGSSRHSSDCVPNFSNDSCYNSSLCGDSDSVLRNDSCICRCIVSDSNGPGNPAEVNTGLDNSVFQ